MITHTNNEIQWYDSYKVRATGEVISGEHMRVFIDWSQDTPERPRYAVMVGNDVRTYLDSEIEPL